MPLSEIHTSGDVPQYKEKLEKGMLNMFKRLRPEKPVLRNNYFIQVDDNLAWSGSLGGEDDEGISWASAGKVEGIENVHFRSERQSLRRWVGLDIKPLVVVVAADEIQASTLWRYSIYYPDIFPSDHGYLPGALCAG
jgi:hypothetical protein